MAICPITISLSDKARKNLKRCSREKDPTVSVIIRKAAERLHEELPIKNRPNEYKEYHMIEVDPADNMDYRYQIEMLKDIEGIPAGWE